jgi:Na+-transporting NADH:ubiquinone oxidoreductase subunit D
MAILSGKTKAALLGPLNKDNPVIVQVLGICSALAVTARLEPAIVMALAVTAVVALANVIISIMRKFIPSRIRMIVQLMVAATLVAIVSELLKAFAFDVNRQLSVFVGLIVSNCILMGRMEAFALGNGPWPSFLDGVGNGLGYAWILIVLGFIRELFGTGRLDSVLATDARPEGVQIIPQFLYDIGYMDNGFMMLAPMAILLMGIIIWVHRARNKDIPTE